MWRSVSACPETGSSSSRIRRLSTAIALVLTTASAGCSADLGRFDFAAAGRPADSAQHAKGPVPSESVRRNAGLPAAPEWSPPPSRTGAVEVAPLPMVPYRDQPNPYAALPHEAPQPIPVRAAHSTQRSAAPAFATPRPPDDAPLRAVAAPAGGTVIEVEQGDTLSVVSKRYGVSISELMTLNDLQNPNLRPGQRLTIPRGRRMLTQRPVEVAAAPSPPPAPTPVRYIPEAPQQLPARPGPLVPVASAAPVPPTPPAAVLPGTRTLGWTGTHTLAPGESLYAIARRHGVKPAELQAANGITDATKLRPGVVLQVPGTIADAAPPSPASRLAAMPSAGPDGPAPAPVRPTIINAPAPEARPADTPRFAALGGAAQPRRDTPVATDAPAAEVASAPALAAGPKLGSTGKFRWPVKGRVIAGFGPRGDGHNDGINISVPTGTDVAAAEAGVVAYAGAELKGYGNLVLVRHDDNWVSAYAHNDQLLVRRGDKVRRGQIIAKAGNTGTADQPQVHFELRQGSKPVDPLPYMEKN